MTSASLQYLARVPCLGSSGIDREPAFVRIRARMRWRAHEGINPGLNRTKTPPAIQSVALSNPSGNVIAAVPPVGSVNWRTAIERPQTHALAVRRFLQWGHTGLLNLCRAKAPGKPSLLPLVHDANQPTRGFFHRFEVSKILSSSALHANNKAWSRPNEVQRKSVPSASGAEHEFG